MMLDMLLMIALPGIFGMMIQDLSNGRVNRFQKSIGGVTAKIGWFFIVLINAALVMPMLTLDLRVIKVFATTLLVAALGYIVGYLAAYCLPSRDRDTELSMMYNVGMRNNSFGIVLALAYFPPSAAIPLMLFMLFQHPLAALATYLYTQKEKKLLALKV
jgi:predicted Na+-dependent transporter